MTTNNIDPSTVIANLNEDLKKKVNIIDNIIDKLINNPILIQRPIAVIIKNGKIRKSIICRPPEKILDFLIS